MKGANHTMTFRIVGPFYVETYRNPKEIKKELKRCRNYMQRKKLEQELQFANRNFKRAATV